MVKNTPYNTFTFMKDYFLNLEEEMNNRGKSHENCNLKSVLRHLFCISGGWLS